MSKIERQATLAIACLDLNLSHLVRVGASEARSICPFIFFARDLACLFGIFLAPSRNAEELIFGYARSTALRIVRELAYNGLAPKNLRNFA
jgi:hypothetical protein